MKVLPLLIALTIAWPASLIGGVYYIDSQSGNDSSDGRTAANAWKTLDKARRATFAPGDEIRLKRGGVWRETLRINQNGTAAAPIILDAYGSGPNPMIIGSETMSNWTRDTSFGSHPLYKTLVSGAPWGVWQGETGFGHAGSKSELKGRYGVYFYDPTTSWLFVVMKSGEDPSVQPPAVNVRHRGVDLDGSQHITVRNLEIKHAGYGIYMEASRFIVTRNNVTHDNWSGGIFSSRASSDIHVSHNESYNNGRGQGGTGITATGFPSASNWVIEHNLVYSNGGNEMFGPSNARAWGGGIDLSHGVTDSVIRYNVVKCDPGLKLPSDIGIDLEADNVRRNDVYYNAVSGCTLGIVMSNASHNRILNNTIYNGSDTVSSHDGAAGIAVLYNSPYNTIKNNIVHSTDPLQKGDPAVGIFLMAQGRTGVQIDNNLYYLPNMRGGFAFNGSSFRTFEQWQSDGFDRNGKYGAPKFVNIGSGDIAVQDGSPAIGAGANVGLDKDLKGEAVPASIVTIGARQRTAPAAAPAPTPPAPTPPAPTPPDPTPSEDGIAGPVADPGAYGILASYLISDSGAALGFAQVNSTVAGTFSTTADARAFAVAVQLRRLNNAQGQVWAELWTVSPAGVPANPILGAVTSPVDVSTLNTGTVVATELRLLSPADLVGGETYALVVRTNIFPDRRNHVRIGADSAGGNPESEYFESRNRQSWSRKPGRDLWFQVLGEPR